MLNHGQLRLSLAIFIITLVGQDVDFPFIKFPVYFECFGRQGRCKFEKWSQSDSKKSVQGRTGKSPKGSFRNDVTQIYNFFDLPVGQN